ncbi:gp436 family protein [Trabulsiella odontotermitis]|uniref:gp436 family protein n=1 Tax=Trabulsiella odontotermitis TaxID=379893 RepID=UPI0009BA06D5|nr:phage protein Gp36 family protein [Trabulsiella odontotermitis]
MSYATPDQFIRTFSERETVSLTDEKRTGQVDTDKLAFALTRASNVIDGYLVARYKTPWPDSPGILTGYCCDIARYQLATDYRQVSDEIRFRYEDAIKFLRDVASGRIGLGRDTAGRCGFTPAFASSDGSRRTEARFDNGY